MKLASIKPRVATIKVGLQATAIKPACYSRQGKRELHTGSKAWRLIRERILLRDGYTCQAKACGRYGNQVDHISGDDSDSRDSNLQTLCKKCHSSKTARENHGFGNA